MVKSERYSTFEEMKKKRGKKMEVEIPSRRRVITGTLIDAYMQGTGRGTDVCVILENCEEKEDGRHIRYSRTRTIPLFKSFCKYSFL